MPKTRVPAIVRTPAAAKSSAKSRFKRGLVAAGLLCSLLVPASLYTYAPRVPESWRPQIREQVKWVHELWLGPRFSPAALRQKIDAASLRARRFPLLYHWVRQRTVARGLGPGGDLEGEDLGSEDSRWPPAFYPGAVMLQRPDGAAHEFVHYLGQSHAGLMTSHFQSAAATSKYLNPESLVAGQKDDPVQLEVIGSKARMHCLGNQAKVIYGFDLQKIEDGFHQPTFESENHHNDESSAGYQLGHLARLEEARIRKPGYGLLVIRLVAQGSSVKAALNRAREPDLEQERQTLIRNNPGLDWSKNPSP